MKALAAFLALLVATSSLSTFAAETPAIEPEQSVSWLQRGMHHIRNGEAPEWSEFPPVAEAESVHLKFDCNDPEKSHVLELRQQDVKQTWTVQLNGKAIGKLIRDENDQFAAFPIDPGSLRKSANELTISTASPSVDDIRVGQVRLLSGTEDSIYGSSTIKCVVLDARTGKPLPSRITLLDENGTLCIPGCASSDQQAVRTGVIYGLGEFEIPVSAGRYQVVAGRGFEYSIDRKQINIRPGQTIELELRPERVVNTDGYVSCDTHVHTLTHSGHGDSTVQERMLTIAGEGIELPIATDHNKQIDYSIPQRDAGVSQYFTSVVGNEVTTRIGHFNVFPLDPESVPPDHSLKSWDEVFASIDKHPGADIRILNHARDIHSGFRPFGPRHHHGRCGRNLDGWRLHANAMETVNSAAQQTDILLLFHDWMGLMNAGQFLTPIGCSDSHDVARHFIGQGRTYVRVEDKAPGKIDVTKAVAAIREGRVLVSCGLLADMTVNQNSKSGDLVDTSDGPVNVEVDVLGASWTQARDVTLFVNGIEIEHRQLTDAQAAREGLKATLKFSLPELKHDAFVTAIATGPGVQGLFWPTARPYQPVSPTWDARVIACTGAVRLDADGDGRFTPAIEYARSLLKSFKESDAPEPSAVIRALDKHDVAVSAQLFFELLDHGTDITDRDWSRNVKTASGAIQTGYQMATEGWRAHLKAKVENRE